MAVAYKQQQRTTVTTNGLPLDDVKLVFLGDSKVGKSSIVHRYCHGVFEPHLQTSIGTAFMTKELEVDGRAFRFKIWDTAGQERFRSVLPMYLRSAKAAILTYDITAQSSFDNLPFWMAELHTHLNEDSVLAVIGNKCDLQDQRQVRTIEGETFAKSHGAIFFETSAKSGVNTSELFLKIGERLAVQYNEADETNIRLEPEETSKKCSC